MSARQASSARPADAPPVPRVTRWRPFGSLRHLRPRPDEKESERRPPGPQARRAKPPTTAPSPCRTAGRPPPNPTPVSPGRPRGFAGPPRGAFPAGPRCTARAHCCGSGAQRRGSTWPSPLQVLGGGSGSVGRRAPRGSVGRGGAGAAERRPSALGAFGAEGGGDKKGGLDGPPRAGPGLSLAPFPSRDGGRAGGPPPARPQRDASPRLAARRRDRAPRPPSPSGWRPLGDDGGRAPRLEGGSREGARLRAPRRFLLVARPRLRRPARIPPSLARRAPPP